MGKWDLKSDSVEPGGMGFAVQGGKGTIVADLDLDTGDPDAVPPVDPDDITVIWSAIIELLGDTKLPPTDGRLVRVPPLCHPTCPWLVATSAASIQGIGDPIFLDPN